MAYSKRLILNGLVQIIIRPTRMAATATDHMLCCRVVDHIADQRIKEQDTAQKPGNDLDDLGVPQRHDDGHGVGIGQKPWTLARRMLIEDSLEADSEDTMSCGLHLLSISISWRGASPTMDLH
jgi:hypothetical protein